jgi:bacterioferritin
MKHAESIIERILFLEGSPEVNTTHPVKVGKDLEQQFKNDREAEEEANRMYNRGILSASEAGDNGTADLLRLILADEEKHLDWLDTQLNLLQQVGSKHYLSQQMN